METTTFFSPITEESLKYCTLREEDIILLKRLKNSLVRSQLYAEAAVLRDIEKQMTQILEAMAVHGFKPKTIPQSEEKVYSIAEVRVMLGLATHPLKKTIEFYEELSRNAIVDQVGGMFKQIHELRTNQKQVESDDKEKLYSIEDVNQMLISATDPLKKTIKFYEELNYVQIQKQEILLKGSTIPIKCEHEGCSNQEGHDYKRKEIEGNWMGEPIFLCDVHNAGFERI